MNFWRSLSGMVYIEVTSADLTGLLSAINRRGVEIFNIRQVGDVTLRFSLHRHDFGPVRRLVRKRGERLDITSRDGVYWTLRRLLSRPVLILGLGFILLLTLYIPGQIYFVEVEGNHSVPTAQIIETAAECGIGFGTNRRSIRSEKLKNALLQAIPNLQWAGINTYGCRAVISVKERPEETISTQKGSVSSIVASRDGIISTLTVQNGDRRCAPGQSVKAGQVLISGYTDCGICIRATQARGEVFAQTQRDFTAIAPLNYLQKVAIQVTEQKYGLLVGKKLINFFKYSGISYTSCDKMYSVNYITLPGDLQLPVALVTETVISYDTADGAMDNEEAQTSVKNFSTRYLENTMIAGQVIQKFEAVQYTESACILQGRYACVEMIGITRFEENLHDYGESN